MHVSSVSSIASFDCSGALFLRLCAIALALRGAPTVEQFRDPRRSHTAATIITCGEQITALGSFLQVLDALRAPMPTSALPGKRPPPGRAGLPFRSKDRRKTST